MTNIFIRILIAALAAGTSVHALASEHLTQYLTARYAALNNQYGRAAELLDQVIAKDPEDSHLLIQSLQVHLLAGNKDEAIHASRRIQAKKAIDSVADTTHLIDLIRENEFEEAISFLEQEDRRFLLDPRIVLGWLHLGNDEFLSAFAALDGIEADTDIKLIAEFHKALAMAVSGDFESADEILSEIGEEDPLTPENVRLAHAQILVQLDDRQRALEILGQGIAPVSEVGRDLIEDLRDRIDKGEQVDFDFVQSPSHGVAEMLKNISQFLVDRRSYENAVLFGRFAELIEPRDAAIQIRIGHSLESLDAHELAKTAHSKVPEGSVLYPSAVIGIARSLYGLDKPHKAVDELKMLAESYSDSPKILFALGNYQRLSQDYAGALESYNAAVSLVGEPADWTAYFYRGIVKERLDMWDEAKAELNRAIELSNGLPVVLNYLGYSMVERLDSLDVAEDLIRRAVAEDEDNAYYIDSLGWVLYQTGRYDDAVRYMEKATRLMPNDPVVVDHLGDTYWKIARRTKARDQWRRALNLDPDEELEQRILRKLEVGLDKVLEEEGVSSIAYGN